MSFTQPDGWGEDSLSGHLETAHRNIKVSFTNRRQWYDRLKSINGAYQKFIDNLTNSPNWFESFFLYRTHSAFLAASQLALAGQATETYMLLRGCLETALYGLYLSDDTQRQEIWLRRHDDEKCKKLVQNEFNAGTTLRHLQSIDSRTHATAKKLYDRTIDWGGHPNERAIFSHLSKINKTVDSFTFRFDYFLCDDLPHQLCLKMTAVTGICCLDIFRNVFKERFDILGITDRLDQLRQGL